MQSRVSYTKLLNFELFALVVIVLNSLRVNGRSLLVHCGTMCNTELVDGCDEKKAGIGSTSLKRGAGIGEKDLCVCVHMKALTIIGCKSKSCNECQSNQSPILLLGSHQFIQRIS